MRSKDEEEVQLFVHLDQSIPTSPPQTKLCSSLNDLPEAASSSLSKLSYSSTDATQHSSIDTSSRRSFPSPSNLSSNGQPMSEKSCLYHIPPEGVDYFQNGSVFGRILEGSLPSYPYAESNDLYAFRDIYPRARLHALVIPKQYIPSVKSLLPSFAKSHGISCRKYPSQEKSVCDSTTRLVQKNIRLVHEMKQMALQILEKEEPLAYKNQDYILCFHVPPFNSVDHLHLHVLAPASEMNLIHRYGKYLIGTPWCMGIEDLLFRLKSLAGKA